MPLEDWGRTSGKGHTQHLSQARGSHPRLLGAQRAARPSGGSPWRRLLPGLARATHCPPPPEGLGHRGRGRRMPENSRISPQGCEVRVLSCVRGKDTKAPGHLQTSALSPAPQRRTSESGHTRGPWRGSLDSGVRRGEVWPPSDPGELGFSWPPWFHPEPPCGRTPSRAERGLTAHPAGHGASGERAVGPSTPGHEARPRRAAPLCTPALAPSRSRAGRVQRLRARPQEARLPAGRRGRQHRLVDRRR